MKLADMKRISEGTTLKLVYTRVTSPKFAAGLTRKIVRKQSNGVQFEGGSWLMYPAAVNFSSNDNITFSILEDKSTLQKLHDYFIPRMRSGVYPITEQKQHTREYMVATDNETLLRYIIPTQEVNEARERVEKVNEKHIILTYEIVK